MLRFSAVLGILAAQGQARTFTDAPNVFLFALWCPWLQLSLEGCETSRNGGVSEANSFDMLKVKMPSSFATFEVPHVCKSQTWPKV